MMDQINAASKPSIMKGLSPLEHALVHRNVGSMPSMKPRKLGLHPPKFGKHENQPAVRPLESGFRHRF